MFSSAKRTRDRSRSSQRSSVDLYPERASQIPEPANQTGAGTKRLFSNRHSRQSLGGDNEEPDILIEVHSEKRHRSGNWPLPNSSPVDPARAPLRNRNVPNSPSLRAPGAQKRPSKFLEGSMNDRVSQKPPVPYLGDDEGFLEDDNAAEREYNNRSGKARPHSCMPHSNVSTTGLSDTSRHSSIFRFGKTIAATFNPSNWKLFKSQAGQQEDGETAQQRVLRERQAKAEEIYAELKQSGHFPTMRTQGFEAFVEDGKLVDKHDSGVSFVDHPRASNDSRTKVEEKRMGRVFLEPTPFADHSYRGESPAPASLAGSREHSSTSSPSKSSFKFRRTSLSNIKKSFTTGEGNAMDYTSEHQPRRTPSRRDLQMQQRLVKRVSDLEGKLEVARRQLNESLAEPLPPQEQQRIRRPRFVPGAMPSLLSERLLSAYLPSEDDEEEDYGEIGVALPFGSPESNGNGNGFEDSIRGRARPERTVKLEQISPFVSEPQQDWNGKKEADIKSEAEDDIATNMSEFSAEMSPSKNSAYVDENHPPKADMEGSESDSVVASSEPLSDEEITPKCKHISAAVPDSASKQTTPKPAPSKTGTNKRKSLADESCASKTTPSETGSEGGHRPRAVLRRKAIGTPSKQPAGVVQLSPPTRAPPPPPASTPQLHPSAKSIKTSSTSSPSSPSSNAARAQNASPSRRISRKAVPKTSSKSTSTSTSTSTSRLTKPRPVAQTKQARRQSVSPPPSSLVFSQAGSTKLSQAISNDETEATSASVSASTSSVNHHSRNENARTLNPYPVSSSSIPPMPKLPKTVRLPTGEVVNVDVHATGPISKAGKAGTTSRASRAASRAAARSATASASASASTVRKEVGRAGRAEKRGEVEMKDSFEEAVAGGETAVGEKSTSLARSDTKASFEWPPDCF